MTSISSKRKTRSLKYLSLFLSVILIGILVSWKRIEGFFEGPPQRAPSSLLETAPQITSKEVVRPHYISHDEQGRPYTIQAQKGTQKPNDAVDLESVSARMSLEDGSQLSVTANNGTVSPGKTGFATLEGQVSLHHAPLGPIGEAYHVYTDKASVDFQKKEVETDSPVTGVSSTYTVHSQNGMHVNQETQTITLKGKSRAWFQNVSS